MKHYSITNIENKNIKITDVEFLFFYENSKNEKYVVFEYEGNKYESKIEYESKAK